MMKDIGELLKQKEWRVDLMEIHSSQVQILNKILKSELKQCHNHKDESLYIMCCLKWRVTLKSELQEA